MVEVFPVVAIGRSAMYALHARVSGTWGSINTIAQAYSSANLGQERTVEIVGGIAKGNICGSGSMFTWGSYYAATAHSVGATEVGAGYVELRRADNSTVVGRVALPITNPVRFSNVQYIYLYVEFAISNALVNPNGVRLDAKSSGVCNATVYFNVI